MLRRQLAEAVQAAITTEAKVAIEKSPRRDGISTGQGRKLIQVVKRSIEQPGDYRKRMDARTAIHKIVDGSSFSAGEALLELLPKLADQLRSEAIRAFGKLRIRSGYEAILRGMLSSSSSEVEASIRAAGNYGSEVSVMPLLLVQSLYPEYRIRVSSSIGKIGQPALATLLSVLKSKEYDVLRFAALEALKEIKAPEAIEMLTNLINREKPPLRHLAVEALTEIRDAKTIRSLMSLASDDDPQVRQIAIVGLADRKDPQALPAFLAALSDTSREIQIKAIEGLGDLGDKSVVPKLSALLNSADLHIQMLTAEAIGKLGDKRIVPKLLDFLDAEIHGNRNTDTLQRLVRILQRVRDPRAVVALCELLDVEDVKLRRRVVETLGSIGDVSARPALERVLQRDHTDEVRAAAAKALGDLGDPTAVSALTAALSETSEVRLKALIALTRFKSNHVLPVVRQMLVDPLPQVRYQVAGLLGEIGGESAIADLEQLVADEDPLVKRAALSSLEALGDKRTEAAILKAYRKSARARQSGVATGRSMSGLTASIPGGAKAIWGGGAVALLVAGLLFTLMRGSDSGSEVPMIRGNVDSIGVSADGQLLVASRNRGMTEVWDVRTDRRLWFTNEVPRGKGVVVSRESQTVMFASSKSVFFFDLDNEGKLTEPVEVPGHEAPISQTVATVDRKFAATLDTKGVVRVWDLAARKTTTGLTIPTTATAIAIDEKGSILVAGGVGMGLQAWSLESTEAVFDSEKAGRIHPSLGNVTSLTISPDNAYLAAAFSEGQIQVYDFSRERKVSEAEILGGRPMLAFNKQNELFIVNRKLYRLSDVRRPELIALGEALENRSTYDFSQETDQIFLASDEASAIVVVNLLTGTSRSLDVREE